MDLRKIKKLIELVEESGIAELEVHSGDESVRIARPSAVEPTTGRSEAAGSPVVAASTAEPMAAAPSHGAPAVASIAVRAPMAGTFYVAAEPGGTAFAPIGAEIAGDAVVCIIESMKMMNEIRAPQGGRCVELLVRDGEPVAAGQVLLRLAPERP
jgi:acetyl-CoA carboxylase biotin carboxyl carrier protein